MTNNTWKTPHLLIKKGQVGKYALLPGDPGRAHLIAKFLDKSSLVTQNREFVVYNGVYKGVNITIASTGIGGPSAAIAVEELARAGTRVFIRVGTCGALRKGIEVGDLIIPYAAVRNDGVTKRYVSENYPAVASPRVYYALVNAAKRHDIKYYEGIILSDDMYYCRLDEMIEWSKKNIIAVEMEASTIFTLTSLKGLEGGAILAVDGNIIEGTGKPFIGESEDVEKKDKLRRGIETEIKIALDAVLLLEGYYM